MLDKRLKVVWNQMNTQCYNKNSRRYLLYGGAGIEVCKEWRRIPGNVKHNTSAFQTFKAWALAHGYTIIGDNFSTIDLTRIDKTKNFSPENCKFISIRDRNLSRTSNVYYTAFGHTFPQSIWCEIAGLPINTFKSRIFRSKWSVEDAIRTPPRAPRGGDYPAPVIPDEYLKYERIKEDE